MKELGEEDKVVAGQNRRAAFPFQECRANRRGQRPSPRRWAAHAPAICACKKEFTDLDRDRFRHEGFEFIARFFENSMQELVKRNPGLDQRFQRVDATHFTAALYQHGQKVCKGSVSIAGGTFGSDSIEYVMDDNPRHGGMNEAVSVKSDDQIALFSGVGDAILRAAGEGEAVAAGRSGGFLGFVYSTAAMRCVTQQRSTLRA